MNSLIISQRLTSLHVRSATTPYVKRREQSSLPLGWTVGAGLFAFIVLGAGSLMLANFTLHLQEERAGLRDGLKTSSEEQRTLEQSLAERESPAALEEVASTLGLIKGGTIVFLDDAGRHLTQQ